MTQMQRLDFRHWRERGTKSRRRLPLPPELVLVGDFLAYIDLFSVLFLLGILSRVTTILFLLKH